MATNNAAYNEALTGSRRSTFDPSSIIQGFREQEDRERRQQAEDEELANRRADRELLLQERKLRMENMKALMEQRRFRTQQMFKDMYGKEATVLDPSQFGMVNDVASRTVDSLNNARYDVELKLRQGEGDASALQKELSQIDGSLLKVKAGYDAIKQISDNYLKAIEEGTISAIDEERYGDFIQRFKRGQVSVEFDDNYNPVFVAHGDNGEVEDFMDIQKLINGDIGIIEDFDISSEMSNLVNDLGLSTFKGADGSSFTGLGTRQRKALNVEIDRLTRDDDVVADVLFKQGENDMFQRDGFTDEQRARAGVILTEAALGASTSKVTEAPVEEEEEIEQNPVELVLDSQGEDFTPEQKPVGLGASAFIPTKVFTPRTEIVDTNGVSFNEILYNDISGRIALKGKVVKELSDRMVEEDVTGSKFTNTLKGDIIDGEHVVTSIPEVTSIISQMTNPQTGERFKNLREFRLFLDNKLTGGEVKGQDDDRGVFD